MVQIDLEALAAAGFVTPQAQRSQIADEFRVLKRPIIRNARERIGARAERANLIMVTSAIPAEGKSFIALNLAMSIALEVDSHALLIDADVANPSLMHMTHLPPASKGLLDLLTNGDTKLHDVLLRTNVEKLTLLPSGTSHGRATEMLASETMAALLEDMASRYPDRILVFDSPPLLATTEARALASHMGQILMVVEADRTTQTLVKHALETIESCPVVMMVLNKAPRPEVGSYYGHHYSRREVDDERVGRGHRDLQPLHWRWSTGRWTRDVPYGVTGNPQWRGRAPEAQWNPGRDPIPLHRGSGQQLRA